MLTLHIKEPLVGLRTMLSVSAATQSFLGVSTAPDALARIHTGYVADDEGREELPRCVVALIAFQSTKGGTWSTQVTLHIRLEAVTPGSMADDPDSAVYLWFLGVIEAIVDDVRQQAGESGALDITQVAIVQPPHQTAMEQSGDREVAVWRAEFAVTAGG